MLLIILNHINFNYFHGNKHSLTMWLISVHFIMFLFVLYFKEKLKYFITCVHKKIVIKSIIIIIVQWLQLTSMSISDL